MSDKLCIIIASGEAAKARTGLMFAFRTLQEGWMEDVKVFIFGPAEKLLSQDQELQDLACKIAEADPPVACKAISDQEDISDKLAALGLKVEYVGKWINELIKEGYTPLVW